MENTDNQLTESEANEICRQVEEKAKAKMVKKMEVDVEKKMKPNLPNLVMRANEKGQPQLWIEQPGELPDVNVTQHFWNHVIHILNPGVSLRFPIMGPRGQETVVLCSLTDDAEAWGQFANYAGKNASQLKKGKTGVVKPIKPGIVLP